jgi:zinc/manganese transport system substrate-binding protein
VTYHKTLNYFLDRFQITGVATLEPKPGIPPSGGHVLGVIRTIREEGVPLILVENYFDPSVADRIRKEIPSVRIAIVPVAVEGTPGIRSLDDLYETLVTTIEGK